MQESAEHRRQIVIQQQQRLLYLRHASRCTHPPNSPGCCPQGYAACGPMKALWEHIAGCRDQCCPYPHCVSSRYVLSHYHRCKEEGCPVCAPVRQVVRESRLRHLPVTVQEQLLLQQQMPPQGSGSGAGAELKPLTAEEAARRREAREEQAEEEREREELQAYLDSNAGHDLCCPIGLGLLADPVVFTDGMTYDRANIEKHVQDCVRRKSLGVSRGKHHPSVL
jgi:E1A/CREB-binding protein